MALKQVLHCKRLPATVTVKRVEFCFLAGGLCMFCVAGPFEMIFDCLDAGLEVEVKDPPKGMIPPGTQMVKPKAEPQPSKVSFFPHLYECMYTNKHSVQIFLRNICTYIYIQYMKSFAALMMVCECDNPNVTVCTICAQSSSKVNK